MQGRYILVACLSTLCGAAHAQEAAPSGPAVETDATLRLPTITVLGTSDGPVTGFVPENSATATKSDVPLIETPASVSVVGAAEIAARGGATNLGEAVAYMPGAFVPPAFTVNTDAVQIRGFWAVNYLDGLRVGNGSARSGQLSIETYGLERIDVLRGPASVLYGQMAPGGIVNEVSKRPQFTEARRSLVRTGSHGLVQGPSTSTA